LRETSFAPLQQLYIPVNAVPGQVAFWYGTCPVSRAGAISFWSCSDKTDSKHGESNQAQRDGKNVEYCADKIEVFFDEGVKFGLTSRRRYPCVSRVSLGFEYDLIAYGFRCA